MKSINAKATYIFAGLLLIVATSCKKAEEKILATASDLSATAISNSRIDILWKDNSTSETAYKIERKTIGGNYSVISALEADATGYSDTGLIANTFYTYRIYPINMSGNGPNSDEVSATTFVLISLEWQKSLGGPSFDYGYSIQQTTDGGYIIAGMAGSNGGDITGYRGSGDFWVVKLSGTGVLQWQKALGGTDAEIAFCIQQTSDGGYIVAGYSASINGNVTGNKGFKDFWVVKLTNIGDLEWQKTLGGSGNEIAYSVKQTSEGGYIIAGQTDSNDGDVTGNKGWVDMWIVKLTGAGTIQWQKTFGGSNDDNAYSIEQATDGGYIIAGVTFSDNGDVTNNHGSADGWVIKLTSAGSIQWQKTYGGVRGDHVSIIRQTSDGGYIMAGHSSSGNGNVSGNSGASDFWITKLNNAGNLQWQENVGGTGEDHASDIRQISDGSYIAVGFTQSNDGFVTGSKGGTDLWIVKFTSSGIFQGQKVLGGSSEDFGYSIQQSSDGGYIVAGFTESNNGDVTGNKGAFDYWAIKILK
jgi:hypothetical protein